MSDFSQIDGIFDADFGQITNIIPAEFSEVAEGFDGSLGIENSPTLQGKDGKDAVITGATATVNNESGIPSVEVITGGEPSTRSFEFRFKNLKGRDGHYFKVDETLNLQNNILSVNTADDVNQNNTLPITSAAVFTTVGNIDELLKTI